MTEKLNGRLEIVKIEKKPSATDNCNYGELLRDKRKVTVLNASSYEGRPCLVRFDLREGSHRQAPGGYLISSVVPSSFEGLAPEQYVLIGLWEKTGSSTKIPTLQEVEEIYRPGNMPFLLYFQDGFSQQQGIYTIDNKKKVHEPRSSIPRFMRRINSQRSSRVFVVETGEDLEKIMAAAKGQNLYSIIMEPLH